MVVVHLGHGIRILFRAVVRILHFGQLELPTLSIAVGIGQVIAHMERTVELNALLLQLLLELLLQLLELLLIRRIFLP